MYIIYKYTSPTNRIYIGKTTLKRESKRKSEHKKRAKKGEISIFYNSIRKYGFEKHSYEVLYSSDLEEDIYKKEKEYILHFNSFKDGLNSSIGGIGVGEGENHPLYNLPKEEHHNFNRFASKSTYYKGDIIATNIKEGNVLILKGKKDILLHNFQYSNVIKCVTGVYKTHKGFTFKRITIN